MKKLSVVCVLVIALVACKKKEPAAAQQGSAAFAATPAAGSAAAPAAAKPPAAARPADLPEASAPATAEVLAKFDAACDGGYAPACYDSGMRRAKGMGTAEDRPAGLKWLEKGCNQDDAESCGLLAGFLAVGGNGVTQDKARAIELHRKACPKAPTSCRLLANYYGRGEVVAKDLPKAMGLLDQACKGGDHDACAQAEQLRASGEDK